MRPESAGQRTSRAFSLLVFVVVTSVAASLFVLATSSTRALGQPTMQFHPSGLDGAGFQNVVAVDPFGSGAIISGGDVSGFHRSTDFGQTWTPANAGLSSSRQLRVAGVVFSPSQAGLVYAAVGQSGSGGGLLRSTDYGRTWSVRSSVPQFSGDNNKGVGGLPQTHPRSTGNVLVMDPAGDVLFAGTFQDGLMRSSDGGATWTTLGLQGVYIRGLALDNSNPGTLYVGTYGSKAYLVRNALGTPSITQLFSAPASVEELVVVGSQVYAAAGSSGVYASNDEGSTWTRLGGSALRTDGPVWLSITGYEAGGQTVLYAGCDHPAGTSGQFDSVMRSTDGGTTWTSVTRDSSIDTHIGSPAGPTWWLSQTQPSMMLGKGGYTAAHISVDLANRNRVFVAGRSGIWGTSNNASTWNPLVRGLGATINRDILADPNNPDAVFVANTDWVLLASRDGMATVEQHRPPSGNIGLALAADPTTSPSTVFVGVGERDTNAQGEVFSNADVLGGGPWVDEGLSTATGGLRPLGIAVGRVNGERVIVAAVEDSGIWRKRGGTWTRVNAVALANQTTKTAQLIWPPGSSVLYLYDRNSGVWRSNDAGSTWTRIWSQTSGQEMSGYVAADRAHPGTLYVSVLNQGVYRLDNADTGAVGSGISPVRVGSFARPGAMTMTSDGTLYVAEVASAGVSPALHASQDGGATWSELDDDVYAAAAAFPFALSAGGSGKIYAALNGNGVIVGEPAPAEDTTAPTQEVTAPHQGQEVIGSGVTVAGSATDDRSVSRVGVALLDRSVGKWLRSDSTWGAYEQLPAALDNAGATSTSWTFAFDPGDPGTYRVEVQAVDAADNSAAATSVDFTLVAPDTSPPSQRVTAPTMDQSITGSGLTFSGATADDRMVAAVRLAVLNRNSNQWLRTDGTWGAYEQFDATLDRPGSPSTGWSYPFGPADPGLYTLEVQAIDASGNAAAPSSIRFELLAPDTVAPSQSVASPSFDQVVIGSGITASGVATDNRSVAAVNVAVYNRGTGQWLRADGSWGAWQQHPAALDRPGTTSTAWSYRFGPAAPGLYAFQVETADAAGNLATRTWVRFELRAPDTTPPSAKITSPTAGQRVVIGKSVNMYGSAADDRAVAKVLIAIRDRKTGRWLQADGSWAGYAQLPARLNSAGAATTGWSFTFDPVTKGGYELQVVAFDTAGNPSSIASVFFDIVNH